MIAKLVTYGDTREAAIQKMLEAIAGYDIEGVATTLPFGKFVCEHEAFTSGHFDTHFVKNYYSADKIKEHQKLEETIAAQLGLKIWLEHKKQLKVPKNMESNWRKSRQSL